VSNKSEEIVVTTALSRYEQAEALRFIEDEMRQSFGCDPPATTGVFFLARLQGKIVGSIALQGTGKNGKLPIENHYEYKSQDSSPPFDRALTVQASRWIATQGGISLSILRASFDVAYILGKKYVLIEAKPYSTKRLGELGVICKEIKDVTLLPERIRGEVGENGMKYFLEPPLPTLYMIDIQESITAFGSV